MKASREQRRHCSPLRRIAAQRSTIIVHCFWWKGREIWSDGEIEKRWDDDDWFARVTMLLTWIVSLLILLLHFFLIPDFWISYLWMSPYLWCWMQRQRQESLVRCRYVTVTMSENTSSCMDNSTNCLLILLSSSLNTDMNMPMADTREAGPPRAWSTSSVLHALTMKLHQDKIRDTQHVLLPRGSNRSKIEMGTLIWS